MYEPFHRLKYSFAATYYDQMRTALPKLVKDKGAKKVCTMYQDDEFGLEVVRGAEAGLKTIGMELAEKTSYKRGATDFSSQVARMKAAGCDFVVLGTIIRETIGAIGEARKTGFIADLPRLERRLHRPDPQARRQGDGRPVRDHDGAEPVPRRGLAADQLLGQEVQDQVQRGPDRVLGLRLQHRSTPSPAPRSKAGPNLTHRQLRQGDGLDDASRPTCSAARRASFTPTKRLGSDLSRLSQLQDGRWKVVSDYIKP